MDIFVIYFRKDYDIVLELTKQLKDGKASRNILMLHKDDQHWRATVRQYIKKCQFVVFFVGERAYASEKIGREIETAMNSGKTVFAIRLGESNRLHRSLYAKEIPLKDRLAFSKKKKQKLLLSLPDHPYRNEVTLDELKHKLTQYEMHDFGVIDENNTDINTDTLFEQYKLIVQTSEDLVQRRQNMNNFYITINSALLTFISASCALDLSDFQRLLLIIPLCLAGLLTTFSWKKMLISYADLNRGKMRVISAIEKKLPASLFDAEWRVIKSKFNGREHQTYTDIEKDIPKIFRFIYILLFVLMLFSALFNMNSALEAAQSCILPFM